MCRVTLGYEELERILQLRDGFDIVRVEDTAGRIAITLTSQHLPAMNRSVIPRKRIEEIQGSPDASTLIPKEVHEQILRDRLRHVFDTCGNILLSQGRKSFIDRAVKRLSEPVSSREQRIAQDRLEDDEDDD